MICWFCQNPVTSSMCQSQACRPYYVIYVFTGTDLSNLLKVQFKISLYHRNDLKEYFVNYHPKLKQMEIIERIIHQMGVENESVNISYDLKPAFKIPYDAISLTPQNAQSRLPILLLLS